MRRFCALTVVPLSLSVASAWAADSAGAMSADAATAKAREVSAKVEQIRGARFSQPVAVRMVDDATARAHFRERILKFYPQDKIGHDQRAFEQLGLLPRGSDLMKMLLDILDEQAGAYYDPETRTFYVLSDMPRSSAPILMAHELTHALDDQRFNIDATFEKLKGDDDRGTAFTAVVEGTATVVMSLFVLAERNAGRLDPQAMSELVASEAGQAKRLRAAPPLLQRSVLAPYQLGQSFLLHGDPMRFMDFRASDADRAFQDPPVSTEQVIHAEKHWDPKKRDLPRAVRLPDLSADLGPGWKQATSGTLGEMVLAVLTGLGGVDLSSADSARPQNWTNRAAAGWGGDVYQHYVNGDRSVTVLAAVWDTAEDAAEFVTSLKPLPGRSAVRRGDTTVVLAGDSGKAPEALADTVFTALAAKSTAPPPAPR